MALAVAHFAPADREQMDWHDFYSTSFEQVHCQLVSETAISADVGCGFSEHGPPDDNPDQGWGIYMQRSPGGPWLINAYGTG
jgi:hypothetical protein